MPFGYYGVETCRNADCGIQFDKKTPWQEHCSDACKSRDYYLRVTRPRRRMERLSGRKK